MIYLTDVPDKYTNTSGLGHATLIIVVWNLSRVGRD